MPGERTTTQANTTEPWGPSQDALKLGISEAQRIYKDPNSSQVYTGSTVIPWARQTMNGAEVIEKNAVANTNGNGLSGQYQRVINNGGFNDAQLAALRNTQGVANSTFDVNAKRLLSLLGV